MFSEITNKLTEDSIEHAVDVMGSRLTTVAAGGNVPLIVRPKSVEELKNAFSILRQVAMPYRVIGNGSNLLIADSGIKDVVIQLSGEFKKFQINGTQVTVGAAYSLPVLAREVSKSGLSGFEFAAGIPASIGGAVKMNAGAHHSDIAAILKTATVCLPTGEVIVLSSKELEFSYRKSSISSEMTVIGAEFELIAGDPESIQEKLLHNLEDRKKHQPLMFPSFGSVFKNPDGNRGSAGKLVEQVGLKGYTLGGAQISDMHGNWIINPKKNALASEVYSLITLAQEKVHNELGVDLKTEVVLWGNFSFLRL